MDFGEGNDLAEIHLTYSPTRGISRARRVLGRLIVCIIQVYTASLCFTDNVNFRLPWRNSSISARVSLSKFCMLMVIHQQDANFHRRHFQAHLALETHTHFRLIMHWTILAVDTHSITC